MVPILLTRSNTIDDILLPAAEQEKEEVLHNSVPGSTTGSFHWFGNFPKDAEDNKYRFRALGGSGKNRTGSKRAA